MISGNELLDDDPADPGEFMPKVQQLRVSETPFRGEDGRPKSVGPPMTAHRKNLIAQIKSLGRSCDWDSSSDAMLQGILNIEQGKDARHFDMNKRPPRMTQEQDDTQKQILTTLQALTGEMKKLNRRVTKLEKSR